MIKDLKSEKSNQNSQGDKDDAYINSEVLDQTAQNTNEVIKENETEEKEKNSEVQRRGKAFIGNFEDLQQYEQNYANKFILTGYRINHSRIYDVVRSIFKWHNETINVWSHFLGALACAITAIIILTYYPRFTSLKTEFLYDKYLGHKADNNNSVSLYDFGAL